MTPDLVIAAQIGLLVGFEPLIRPSNRGNSNSPRSMANIGLLLKPVNMSLTLYSRTLLLCMFADAV